MAKCLNPKCTRPAETRGLCNTCYRVIRDLVRAGKTTWEALEMQGKALAPRKSPSTAREWVIGGPKKKSTRK